MTLTRTELYQLVWSEPMTQLAKRFGLSDVGLAKLCRKHDVPRPPRGYWTKQHSNRPQATPLPDPDRNDPVSLRELVTQDFISPALSPEIEEQIAKEKQKDSPVIVNDALYDSHRLVGLAKQQLQEACLNKYGLLDLPEGSALDVRVSNSSVERSLLIMDALLKALEQRGYEVTTGPQVRILGVRLSFGIREHVKTHRERPDEVDLSGPYSFFHSRYVRRFVPTGRLTLHVPEAQLAWADGCRQALHDGKQPLEDRLNVFISGLIETAARKTEHEARQRPDERQQSGQDVRRQELRPLVQSEQARADALRNDAEQWRQNRNLRKYLRAARQEHVEAFGSVEPGGDFAAWLVWALQQADRLDPLVESPPTELDEVIDDDAGAPLRILRELTDD